MRKAVWTKFNQHPRLATMLVETGDAEIVEHTENDAYWGDGGDGKGQNRLGQILMQVRAELRAGNSRRARMRAARRADQPQA